MREDLNLTKESTKQISLLIWKSKNFLRRETLWTSVKICVAKLLSTWIVSISESVKRKSGIKHRQYLQLSQ